jgi:magnesium transporter
MLAKMGNKLERIEEEIFEGKGDEVVRDISNVKQEIINFRKIVRPQRLAFRDLGAQQGALHRRGPRHLLRRPDRRLERAWDMLENYKEVVEGWRPPTSPAIAHRTNETFRGPDRDLADLLPLTLIASSCSA